MNNFSDEQYWNLIAHKISVETNIGSPENWNKSMIENFIFNLIERLEIECQHNEFKAKLCRVPKIKGAYAFDQLKFSYDSFRRIFITKESKGNKTTKHMFAIYLGYSSYIEFWNQEADTENEDLSTKKAVLISYYSDGKLSKEFIDYIDSYLLAMIGKKETPLPKFLYNKSSHQDSEIKDLLIAVDEFRSGNWKSASRHFEKSKSLFERYFQVAFMAGIAYYNIRFETETFNKALYYFDLAINNLSINADNDMKARIFTYKGAALKRKQDYDKALIATLKGLSFAEHNWEKARAHYNLAGIYALKNDNIGFNESIEYLKNNSEKYFLQAVRYLKRWSPEYYKKINYG